MVFESLADKLQQTFKKLRGKGKLSESDVAEALKEVRMALLEADVNFKVVKDLVAKIKERAIGQEVLESLTPAQHVVKIVNEELTNLMGGTQSRIAIASRPPTVIMLVGLQGAGKTTTAGKLANLLKRQGKRPLMVAADVYRPAAIKQLEVLGEQLEIPIFTMGQDNPVNIAKKAVDQALMMARDIVIIDTAGRLHINEELMNELKSIKQTVKPHEILLVVDAMTGQDAVNVAESFNNDLGIDGIILTKLDGDARGGAALSIKAVTGQPIKFAGMGEKLDALEQFHPDRMASRILGMGDVLSLIEKAESTINLEKAQEMQKKLRKEEFTLDDFLEQIEQVRKLGPLDQILGMLPGMGKLKGLQGLDIDNKEVKHIIAIIHSMTAKERRDPAIINGSRRKRIAIGSGTRVQDVNRLLKQFVEAKKMMKRLKDMQKSGKKPSFKLPFMQ
ncbi:Signal recognition particle protein [Sporomusa ovata DSM 2662]|uniref:Signal recognition particle protein n=1 Tax=Sporomusa ovata TaxID=2378 RepID=A0A0U1KXM4_9FIRM|nr:signal recognition particle protein [Sporomusa ovata]EQB29377.1 signal recognition particle protein [Sporomusa ovata DSM 2662]CQR71424.1 Signal recognition particle, subunit Ffh SRP54 (TC 3.A.5.1.1) [Sporomusa ovata]